MEKLITEASLKTLKMKTDSLFDTPRSESSRQVTVSNLKFVNIVSENTLRVTCNTKSKDTTYDTAILFSDVEFVDQEDQQRKTKIFTADGQEVFLLPISKNDSDIQVSCTCLDFYFMFSVWNHRDNSLLGQPPKPYLKRTDRAPRNPTKAPGVCKHIIRLSDELTRMGILSQN